MTVAQAAQAITFAPAATASVNSTVVLSATGGASGNPVTYTVTGPATLAGNVLTINGAGTVTVTANQAGNTDYLAAPPGGAEHLDRADGNGDAEREQCVADLPELDQPGRAA